MKSFFQQDLKRSFLNKGFVLGVSVLTAILMTAAISGAPADRSRSSYHIMFSIFGASGFGPFAAIFPVLAYSSNFCEEYQSGYYRMIISRMSTMKFTSIRMISVGLSGGVIIALPITISCIYALIAGMPGIPQGSDTGILDNMVIKEYIIKYGDWSVIAGKTILGFLFGATWALVGLAFSIWIPNRYVALIAPFVVYEAVWLGFGEIPYLNPIWLLRGDDLNNYPLSALLECMYLALTVCVILLGMKRRLRDD